VRHIRLEVGNTWVLSSRSVVSGWPRRSTANCCARRGWLVVRPVSNRCALLIVVPTGCRTPHLFDRTPVPIRPPGFVASQPMPGLTAWDPQVGPGAGYRPSWAAGRGVRPWEGSLPPELGGWAQCSALGGLVTARVGRLGAVFGAGRGRYRPSWAAGTGCAGLAAATHTTRDGDRMGQEYSPQARLVERKGRHQFAPPPSPDSIRQAHWGSHR